MIEHFNVQPYPLWAVKPRTDDAVLGRVIGWAGLSAGGVRPVVWWGGDGPVLWDVAEDAPLYLCGSMDEVGQIMDRLTAEHAHS